MGIPAEGIGLLIAVDAIPDIFATTLNVTGDMVAAALVSRNHVMADDVVSVEPVAAHAQP
jgi:Na+/H+-dicarboxylate symporter